MNKKKKEINTLLEELRVKWVNAKTKTDQEIIKRQARALKIAKGGDEK